MARSAKNGKVKVEFGNLHDDEPVFILRGRDPLAAKAVRFYAKLRRKAGDDKGASSCLKAAQALSDWPQKRMPD